MWCAAALLAAGLAASQLLLGGWYYPVLAAPGYLLVGLAAVVAGVAFWKTENAPGAWCIGVTLLFAGYLFWRQAGSPDAYVARDDAWLLLGALAVYLMAAWQLRGAGPTWLVLVVLFVLMLAGAFTFLPGRRMSQALFPETPGLGFAIMILLALGAAWLLWSEGRRNPLPFAGTLR